MDLYYLHFPDNKTPFSESIGELGSLKEEGKFRAIVISDVPIEQLKEANAHGDISVVQSAYNMLDILFYKHDEYYYIYVGFVEIFEFK